MALQAIVDSIDVVDESFRPLYTEKDGKFHLSVEGMVPRAKIDEFRQNNISLQRERDELAAKYKDVDPEKYRELADKAEKERGKRMMDAGKVEELVAERVATMKIGFDKQVEALAFEKTQITKQLEGLVIDGAIRDAASKSGVRPSAIEDVLLRGRSVFQLQDGKAVPMDGDKPIYGKSGDHMEITEWVSSLIERAPHLFEPSLGGGSRGASGNPLAPTGTIRRDDTAGFLANIEKIAAGKTTVVS